MLNNFYNEHEKRIEVFHVGGDPTLAFEWAHIIAQEMYAERGLRVFKTYSGHGNFLKGYSGEECILLLGHLDQDMGLYETLRFLKGINQERFDNVDLSNVNTIIITGYQDPLDWNFTGFYPIDDKIDLLCEIDHRIELRKTDTGLARITDYRPKGREFLSETIIRENVDIDAISLEQIRTSHHGYFDNLNVMECIMGTKDELDNLSEKIEGLPVSKRRKILAMIEARYIIYIAAKQVLEFINNMDTYVYLPYILNDRDSGYDLLNSGGRNKMIGELSLFFDFEAYGKDMGTPEPETIAYQFITKYGCICGIDPWLGIPKEYIE